jgi:uncharacterized protein with PQ loop repeat
METQKGKPSATLNEVKTVQPLVRLENRERGELRMNKWLDNKVVDTLFGWSRNRNPIVSMGGTAAVTVATISTALITREPNVAGAVAMVGLTYVSAPQMLETIRLKSSTDAKVAAESTKDLNIGFLVMNEVACALYTAYGFAIHSIPIAGADIACFLFGAVPAVIKLQETLNLGRNKVEVQDAEGGTKKTGAISRVWGNAKEKLQSPAGKITAVAATLTATAGVIAYSMATKTDPNIIGGIAAATVGALYAPQAVHTAIHKSTEGISFEALLVDSATMPITIAYSAMIGAVPVIISSTAAMLFGGVVTVMKARDMMRDWAKRAAHAGAADTTPKTEQKR